MSLDPAKETVIAALIAGIVAVFVAILTLVNVIVANRAAGRLRV